MIVKTNNFIAICHGNKLKYSAQPTINFTSKAGRYNHNHLVPILYNHKYNDQNAVIGNAVLKWCSDTYEMRAECHLTDNAKKYLTEGASYSLDVFMSSLKYTCAGNIRDYIIREVSIVPHESLPEHEEIIFKFLKKEIK